LVFEECDYLVEDGVLFVSLGFFFIVGFSLVLEVGDGLGDGVLRFLEDDLALGLLSEGSLDLSLESVSIDLLSVVFNLKE
jgi:hypothetical protein